VIRAAAVMVVALATLPPASARASRSCGTVGFAPASDAGAFDIRAFNLGCGVARAVARDARHVSVTRGPFRYRTHGFTCKGEPSGGEVGLPAVSWRCNKPAHRVLFRQT
jgi:hypothetical protein